MCFVYSWEWGHVCETNVCFLSKNRKRFICEVFSQFWCECFRNFSNLFSSPAACCLHSPGDKTKSGCSCGITTNPVKSDERSKLETTQEVKRDKNLKCSSSLSFQMKFQFISNWIKLWKAIIATVKNLILWISLWLSG